MYVCDFMCMSVCVGGCMAYMLQFEIFLFKKKRKKKKVKNFTAPYENDNRLFSSFYVQINQVTPVEESHFL